MQRQAVLQPLALAAMQRTLALKARADASAGLKSILLSAGALLGMQSAAASIHETRVMPYLCAGSHCIAGNGCRLDITAESREEAGLRRLLHPEAWSLQLCSPALAGEAAAADLLESC